MSNQCVGVYVCLCLKPNFIGGEFFCLTDLHYASGNHFFKGIFN